MRELFRIAHHNTAQTVIMQLQILFIICSDNDHLIDTWRRNSGKSETKFKICRELQLVRARQFLNRIWPNFSHQGSRIAAIVLTWKKNSTLYVLEYLIVYACPIDRYSCSTQQQRRCHKPAGTAIHGYC